VRGFEIAIDLAGADDVVQNVLADRDTVIGIGMGGPFAIVRDNRVTDTGGSTLSNNSAFGIEIDAPPGKLGAARVLNNDVNRTFTGGSANGGEAIVVIGAIQNLVVNNRLTGADKGIDFAAGGAGKFRDNLTDGVTNPYTGGTDAGNNK
jgi:hypothetical protein